MMQLCVGADEPCVCGSVRVGVNSTPGCGRGSTRTPWANAWVMSPRQDQQLASLAAFLTKTATKLRTLSDTHHAE